MAASATLSGSPLDTLIVAADGALRALFAAPPAARAPSATPSEVPLSTSERGRSAALMRVNHAGEIAAQALYHGQALVARDASTREFMLRAAREEGDHLAWCASRLRELNSHTSRLNPLWYAGSFLIGAASGAIGDRWSLGFVNETERQVEGHLEEHLRRLPARDLRSRAILATMKNDEMQHGAAATRAGAHTLPPVVSRLMRVAGRLMTRTAYWL